MYEWPQHKRPSTSADQRETEEHLWDEDDQEAAEYEAMLRREQEEFSGLRSTPRVRTRLTFAATDRTGPAETWQEALYWTGTRDILRDEQRVPDDSSPTGSISKHHTKRRNSGRR